MKLEGKVVLVTGASMGIGLEAARVLVRRGARTAFAARSRPLLDSAVAAAGPLALAAPMDVTDEASVLEAVTHVQRTLGPIDVVINSAGNGGTMSRWLDADPRHLEAMLGVHVLGAEKVMRAVVPSMLRRGGGTIVNLTSTLGYVAMPGTAAYNAAKAAIIMLSRTMRAELRGRGIDVRLFGPPHTRTEAGQRMPLPLPKVFEPAWVGEQLVRFLEGRRAEKLAGGNGSLLLVQRLSPPLASRIMEDIGFGALRRLEGELATTSAP